MPERSLPRILVTNDDGIDSAGLIALEKALAPLGNVTVVAPREQRSACSRSISLYSPIRCETLGPDRYAIDGTPVDAVILAVNHLLPQKPSLVVSGINRGGNRGQNVYYSGTVGAAVEGTLYGIPSIAVSLWSRPEFEFERAAAFVAQLAALVLKEGLPPNITLNINVPKGWVQGVRLATLGKRTARHVVLPNKDAQDGTSYWIRETVEEENIPPDSDYAATRDGCISITPLLLDCEEAPSLRWLEQWIQSFQSLPVR